MQQQAAGQPQTGVDVIAAVEVGIVDQPFPAHGGAGLLEIDPHHHLQLGAVALARFGDEVGVLVGRRHVVHRAGPHDHQQAGIAAMEDRLDPLPGLLHRAGGPIAEGEVPMQHRRRHQRPGFHDVEIAGGGVHEVQRRIGSA